MVAHMRRNEILLQGILSLRSKIDIKTDDIWAYEKDWSHCCHPIDSLTNFWPKHEITCKFLHTVPHIAGYKLTGEVCIWSAIGAKGLILHLSRHLCHHFLILVFTCICSVEGVSAGGILVCRVCTRTTEAKQLTYLLFLRRTLAWKYWAFWCVHWLALLHTFSVPYLQSENKKLKK